jgi:hypothetical protein
MPLLERLEEAVAAAPVTTPREGPEECPANY